MISTMANPSLVHPSVFYGPWLNCESCFAECSFINDIALPTLDHVLELNPGNSCSSGTKEKQSRLMCLMAY